MEKRTTALLLLGILLVSSSALAQEQAKTYSDFDRFIDNIRLFFSDDNNKVKLALEIREKEVNSALENAKNGNTENAIKNLNNAQDKLKIIQEKISLNTSEEIKASIQEMKEKINKNNISEDFKKYELEEEKVQLTAELTIKTFEYCKELAKEGYEKMLKEEICNPDAAVPGLEKELRELKDIQGKLFVQLMLNVRSCIDDPGTCNCDDVLNAGEKAKCEKMVALAVKCEYKDDDTACGELDSMKPAPSNGFAKSFIPDFLMNLFSEKHDMIEYNLTHSDGVPEECWDKNDKPECEQYAYLKETRLDWDERGNFIGTNRAKGIQEPVPTMQESIPQCYDEGNNFLEEKCGKITVVRNKEGLINYIIEKEVENIADKFENASEQHTIDVNGTEGRTIVNEMKEEISGIETQIAERTFAPGTEGTGEPGNDVKNVVVEEGSSGSGGGGLTPEIKTDVAGGSGGGGLEPEVVTDVAGGGSGGDNGLTPEIVTSP